MWGVGSGLADHRQGGLCCNVIGIRLVHYLSFSVTLLYLVTEEMQPPRKV